MSTFPAELTGTWQIDAVHSTVGFAAKHAMVATTRGRFETYTGGATIDATSAENSSLWVDIDAAQRQHRQRAARRPPAQRRLLQRRGAPADLVPQHPRQGDGDEVITAGDLTVAGVTHPVEIRWEFGGLSKDPYGNQRAGFEGTAR